MNLEQLAKLGCNALIDLFNEVQASEGEQQEIALDFERGGTDYKIILATGHAIDEREIPRTTETALAAEVERLRKAISTALELINSAIAADDDHSADELGQADNILASALAQQKQEGGE